MTKVLIIRYKLSKNIMEGGEQASEKNLRVIGSIVGKDNVSTIYIHDESKKRSSFDYIKGIWYFFQNYFFGLSPKRVEQIVKEAQSYDIVFVDRSLFGIIAKKLKDSDYKGKVVSFFHNVEKVYFSAKCRWYQPWRPLVKHCADVNDRYACKYSDKIITLNSRDSNVLKKLYGREADAIVPIAFKDIYSSPSDEVLNAMTSKEPTLLFLGAYFTANVDGLKWFIKNVYQKISGVKLIVAGKGMDKIQNASFMTPDIKLMSNVPDLRPLFEEADAMILPIFDGSGMKVKTCESLMYGKNIFATDEALEGYEADFDKVGGRCNTAEEFIRCINDIIENPRPRFNKYSREVFLEKYSEESVTDRYRSIIE